MEIISFQSINDTRGNLIVQDKLPFLVKRTFFMYGCKDNRGGHAHRKCRMILFAVSGGCSVDIYEKNKNKQTIKLDSCEYGLLLEPEDFHVMNDFSEDCILMVLASEIYLDEDYIYAEEFFNEKI